jgi:hypothetical protein
VIALAPAPHSAWWHFGCWWSGRDAITSASCEPPRGIDLQRDYVRSITQEAHRYSLHAMVKGPFRLGRHAGAEEIHLRAALIARELDSVPLPSLIVRCVDSRLALVPSAAAPEAWALVRRCVLAFSAVPTQAALQQDFHMPLTCRLPAPELADVARALAPVIDRLNCEPLLLDALSLFVEPAPEQPFVLARRYGFDESVEVYSG